MSTTRQKIARSLIWSGLESVGLSGLSFVALVVFSRFLSPVEFGVASMALAVIQVLGIFVEVGFHDALVQKADIGHRHFDTAFVTSTLIGLILCCACWVFADSFSTLTGEPQAGEVLQWMSLSLPLSGLGATLVAQQRRELQFKNLALRSLVGRFAAAVIGIGLAIMGAGVWSLVAQQVLMVGLSTASLWLLSSFRPRFSFSRDALRSLATFWFRTVLATSLVFSIQRVFMLMMGARFGAESAGYVNLAFRAVDMLRDLLAGAISQLALPFFSKSQDDRHRLFLNYNLAIYLTCTVMYPIFALIAIMTPEIINVVFGSRWQPAAPFLVVMSVLTFQFFPRMFSTPLMTSLGYPQYPIPSQIIQLVVISIGMMTLGSLSLNWAVAVWALRLVITTPIDMYRLKRATGLTFSAQISGVPTVFSITMIAAALAWVVCAYGLTTQSDVVRLISACTVGAAIYLLLTFLFNRRSLKQLINLLAAVRTRAA